MSVMTLITEFICGHKQQHTTTKGANSLILKPCFEKQGYKSTEENIFVKESKSKCPKCHGHVVIC